MKTSMLVSMTVAAASAAMADVVLPNTSKIADIQSAIDNAQLGEVITLADGTYVFDQTLYVTNGVTLTGSGRDACILAGDGTTKLETAIVLDHADGETPRCLGGVQDEQQPVLGAEGADPADIQGVAGEVGGVGAHHGPGVGPQQPRQIVVVHARCD